MNIRVVSSRAVAKTAKTGEFRDVLLAKRPACLAERHHYFAGRGGGVEPLCPVRLPVMGCCQSRGADSVALDSPHRSAVHPVVVEPTEQQQKPKPKPKPETLKSQKSDDRLRANEKGRSTQSLRRLKSQKSDDSLVVHHGPSADSKKPRLKSQQSEESLHAPPGKKTAMVITSDEFQGYDSLNKVIGKGEGSEKNSGPDSAPSVLINMEYLLDLEAGVYGEAATIPCRQGLPKGAIFDGEVDDDVLVISLSYCWKTAKHPDPDRETLTDVCKFLRFVDKTRFGHEENSKESSEDSDDDSEESDDDCQEEEGNELEAWLKRREDDDGSEEGEEEDDDDDDDDDEGEEEVDDEEEVGGNEDTEEVLPKKLLETSERLSVGDLVTVADDYKKIEARAVRLGLSGDKNGPLKPGVVGILVKDDEDDLPFKVKVAGGKTHWYMEHAIRKATEEEIEATAGEIPDADEESSDDDDDDDDDDESDDGGGIGARRVVVFWDWASLYQETSDYKRTPQQLASFKAGLKDVNIWYAHMKSWVLLATRAIRSNGYHDSGWPTFEYHVSNMIKPSNLVYDLPTALEAIDSLKGDQREVYWLQESCRKKGRKLTMAPHTFSKVVETKIFTNGSDIKFVQGKYADTYSAVVSPAVEFTLHDLTMVTDDEWAEFLQFTIPNCRSLTKLDLSMNPGINSTLKPFSELLLLNSLELSCDIGLFGSLTPIGGLTKLEVLDINGCVGLEGPLDPLSKLTLLRNLDINSCGNLVPNLTNPFAALLPLRKLEKLSIQFSQFEKFAEMIEEKDDLELRIDEDNLAIWNAAYFGNSRAMKRLCESNFGINSFVSGCTSLFMAVQNGHFECAKLLLDHGADLSLLTKKTEDDDDALEGASPLFAASWKGHAQILKLILEKEKSNINHCADDDNTPIEAAAENGYTEVVEILIQYGASFKSPDSQALELAAKGGHEKTVETLLKHGAFSDASELGAGNYLSGKLVTAAASGGSVKILELLMQNASLDIYSKSDDGERSPLFVACQFGHVEVVKLLLARMKQNNRFDFSCDTTGYTPLSIACRGALIDVVELVLECSDLTRVREERTFKGDSLLHIAAGGDSGHEIHRLALIKLIIERGIGTVDRTNLATGQTPLHCAALAGHWRVVEYFCSRDECTKTIIDKQDEDGETALWKASALGDFLTAEQLIKHGADVNIADIHDTFPLDMARVCDEQPIQVMTYLGGKKQQEQLIGLLLKHGARESGVESDEEGD